MNDDVKNYIDQYRKEIIELFHILRNLIISSVHENLKEKLWAKLPIYYIEDKFIRLIPFKDHINIEAKSILQYKKELKELKITPKGWNLNPIGLVVNLLEGRQNPEILPMNIMYRSITLYLYLSYIVKNNISGDLKWISL